MIDKNKVKKNDINKVLMITIVLNIFLLLIKVIAGKIANSTSLIADGLHSGSDVITSVGVIIGMTMAKKPRDEMHHYGHEKIETVTTFLLSIILIYSGAQIGYNAFKSILNGNEVFFSYFALSAAFISILIKEMQYQLCFKVGKKHESPALIADAWHHRSDALSSVASFVGVLGAKYGIYILDSLGGLIVSLLVIKVGINIFKDCSQELIDVSIHTDEIDKTKQIILDQVQVKDIGDMRARKHGTQILIDITICVDPFIDVYEGHEIAERVEFIIKEKIQNVKDVMVHVDPYTIKQNNI